MFKGVLYLAKIKGRNADFFKGLCKKKEMWDVSQNWKCLSSGGTRDSQYMGTLSAYLFFLMKQKSHAYADVNMCTKSKKN